MTAGPTREALDPVRYISPLGGPAINRTSNC
ncbi:MAG: phosphopantothenoylcysteine decarboxylase [Porticoccaceae bacterium]